MCVCVYVHINICIYMHICIYTSACRCRSAASLSAFSTAKRAACSSFTFCMCVWVCKCVYVCVGACMCVCEWVSERVRGGRVCVCMCKCVCVSVLIRICPSLPWKLPRALRAPPSLYVRVCKRVFLYFVYILWLPPIWFGWHVHSMLLPHLYISNRYCVYIYIHI